MFLSDSEPQKSDFADHLKSATKKKSTQVEFFAEHSQKNLIVVRFFATIVRFVWPVLDFCWSLLDFFDWI